MCDCVSDCLRVFSARPLNRSNSVLITLPLLQSSCHCCNIYFFIYNNTSSIQKTVVSFHLQEFVAILLYISKCKSGCFIYVFELFCLETLPSASRFSYFLSYLFPAPMHASAALAQGHAGRVSIIP